MEKSSNIQVAQPIGSNVAVVQPVMLNAQPQIVQPQMLPPPPQVVQPQMTQIHQPVQAAQPSVGGFAYSSQQGGSFATPPVINQPTAMDIPRQNHVGPAPPKDAPYGGVWKVEKYCGCVTFTLCLFGIPACFCPCDERRTYIAPDGKRYFIGETSSCCFC
mmetsp:Transcript_3946/g.5207  ORF Transcript_3946/g.5207 Transcript_3946/m.5207 type:complete len:160 (-) Transcript_3946:80-559(-)